MLWTVAYWVGGFAVFTMVLALALLVVSAACFRDKFSGAATVNVSASPLVVMNAIRDYERLPVSGTYTTSIRKTGETAAGLDIWQEVLNHGETVVTITTVDATSTRVQRHLHDATVGMTGVWTVELKPVGVDGTVAACDVRCTLDVDLSRCRGLFKPMMRIVFTVAGGRTSGLVRYCKALLARVEHKGSTYISVE